MNGGHLNLGSWARRVLPFALAAAVLAPVGCGGDSGDGRLLSRQQARDLRATLSQIEQNVTAGDCTGAAQQVSALQGQIDSIRRLDRKLRGALRASTRRLDALVSADCETTTKTTPTQTTTTPEEGATGATGTTGEQGKNPKKPKKEKKTPPGKDEESPSAQGDQGGGGGTPGEVIPDGDTTP
jgi:hypothetical protein